MTQDEFDKVLRIKRDTDSIVEATAEKLAEEAIECLSRLMDLDIPIIERDSRKPRRMISIEYDPENVRLVYDVPFDG